MWQRVERSDAWPVFVDSKWAVACWTHPDRDRRVFLIQRRDGTFSNCSEYFSEGEFEKCWIQDDESCSLYDSEDTAIDEIHSSYPWTKDIEPERSDSGP